MNLGSLWKAPFLLLQAMFFIQLVDLVHLPTVFIRDDHLPFFGQGSSYTASEKDTVQ